MYINNRYDTLQKLVLIAFAQVILILMGDTRKVVRFHPTELVIPTFQKRFMDGVVELDDGTLMNIEFQTVNITEEFLLRCAQYAINLRVISGRHVETNIFSTGSRIKSKEIAAISEKFHFKPKIFFYSEFNGLEKLINIKNKIKNQEKLSIKDHYDLIFIPLMGNVDNVEVAFEVFDIVNDDEIFTSQEQSKIKQCQYIVADIIADGDKDLFKKFMEKIKMLTMLAGYIEDHEEEVFDIIRDNRSIEIAQKLKGKLSPEEISKVTGLSLEEIEKL